MPTSVDSSSLPFAARDLLLRCPDRAGASARLAELESRFPHFLGSMADTLEILRWLVSIFSFSAFLSDHVLNDPACLDQVSDLDASYSKDKYSERLRQFLASHQVTTAATIHLALYRRQELLRLVIQDVLAFQTLSEITQQLSSLADAILECAVENIGRQLNARFGAPLRLTPEPLAAAFSVIALGKLGGLELNYSSDIDLMFIYDQNGETQGPQPITHKEYFRRLATGVTELLSTYSPAGVCYRVDLRLRPEGKLGDVAISLDGAQEYYANRARDWELQMLIKARVAAGESQPGEALLEFVEPSIYSTSLDFSTIETMSDTRGRIAEQLNGRMSANNELDIKLCPGGIRDVEFLVQCLQRLHGGREPWVRHGGTLVALNCLLEKDLLSANEHRRLSKAYEFLRHLEHRLQIEDDRQTHSLPIGDAELCLLARRMPTSCLSLKANSTASLQLLHTLNRHLENVRAIYDRIIEAQRPLQYGHLASCALPTKQEAALPDSEKFGDPSPDFNTDLIDTELINRLQHAAPNLAEKLTATGHNRSGLALRSFVSCLLDKHPDLLATLSEHVVLHDYILQIFELSPFLSGQLIHEPGLIMQVLAVADQPNRRWAFEGMAAPLSDTGALRRFFRHEMFRVQAASICLREPAFQTLDRTSAVAEFVIARAYRIALEEAVQYARDHATHAKPFEAPKSEMMVVALGRLGMREFDVGSDADLLFILPDSEASGIRFWTRVAERLIDILTAYTGDGTLISLDTRLRPNGREGPLVQTESAYTDYFSSKAEAWEGMAYMKARAVAGDLDRATVFLTELQQVDWRRYGQSGRSKQDLRTMRARLQREQGPVNPLKAGPGGYYDADFILMYLRLKGAGLFFKSLNTPERIDIIEKMGHLDRSDAVFLNRATTYFRGLDHALRLVAGHPQDRLPTAMADLEMISDLLQRWTAISVPAADLETELLELQKQMRGLFDRVFF